MTKIISFLTASALALFLSVSCSGVHKLDVPLEDTGVNLLGMGAELDPHFFSQNLTRNDGATEEDWYNIVYPRTKAMGLQRLRVMLQPHWWEPFNDNDDPFDACLENFRFNSLECRSVYEVLDLAENLGADVTLVLWGCRQNGECIDPEVGNFGLYFNADPEGTNWVTRCRDDEEFAENFIVFVKHLIRDMGYSCIREITPYNEPDGNVSPIESYIPTAKALAARLKAEGLEGEVVLNLSDNTDTRRYYLRDCTKALGEEAGLFNSHTYIFGYDDPNRKAFNWEKRNLRLAKKAGRAHFVGEFGSDLCRGASRQEDINWYKRGVLIARNAINFLNAGASGCSYWGLIDQYYGRNDDYAQMQQLGLWRYKLNAYQDEDLDPAIPAVDYACRPQYYAYSLLTRNIRKGARVYPLKLGNSFAAGCAVLNPDGSWAYILANGSEEDLSLSLHNPHSDNTVPLLKYDYSEETLPEDASMIEASGSITPSESGRYELCLKSQTLVVLTGGKSVEK